MVLITIVTGAYKPTYNWGASHCIISHGIMVSSSTSTTCSFRPRGSINHRLHATLVERLVGHLRGQAAALDAGAMKNDAKKMGKNGKTMVNDGKMMGKQISDMCHMAMKFREGGQTCPIVFQDLMFDIAKRMEFGSNWSKLCESRVGSV